MTSEHDEITRLLEQIGDSAAEPPELDTILAAAESGRGHNRRGVTALIMLTGAAVIAVTVAVALWRTGDEPDQTTVAVGPTPATAPAGDPATPELTPDPSPAPSPHAPSPPPEPPAPFSWAAAPGPRLDDGRPATWIGVRGDGVLVVVDTLTGTELAAHEPPSPSNNVITAAWPVRGTETIYPFLCCEPAGGIGLLVDGSTALSQNVAAISGWAAVPSPDATLVAVPTGVGLYARGAAPSSRQWELSSSRGAPTSGVAWLHGRRAVAWTFPSDDGANTVLEIIELDDDNRRAGIQALAIGAFNVSLAGAADGSLVLSGCAIDPVLDPCPDPVVLVLGRDGDLQTTDLVPTGALLAVTTRPANTSSTWTLTAQSTGPAPTARAPSRPISPGRPGSR